MILRTLVQFVRSWCRSSSTCEDHYQTGRRLRSGDSADIYIRTDYQDTIVTTEMAAERLNICQRKFQGHSSPESSMNPAHSFSDRASYHACSQYSLKRLQEGKCAYNQANHEVIGGAKLAFLKDCDHLPTPKETGDLFYHTRWWYVLPALKLWWYRDTIPRVPQPLPLVTHRDAIRRFWKHYEMEKAPNMKATILLDVMRDLHTALQLDRPLVIYLPIAFFPSPTVNNNIGLMWLTYTPGDTVESIAHQMMVNRYQVLGTNFVLYYNILGNQRGPKTRQSVDAVLTMIVTEDVEDTRMYWSFKHVSDYPVYVSISPVIDRARNKVYVTQTMTVSTPALDASFLQVEQGRYTEVDKSFFLIE